jgi:GT2 family glycosyltransferase
MNDSENLESILRSNRFRLIAEVEAATKQRSAKQFVQRGLDGTGFFLSNSQNSLVPANGLDGLQCNLRSRVEELSRELEAIRNTKIFKLRDRLVGPKSFLRQAKAHWTSKGQPLSQSTNRNEIGDGFDQWERWSKIYFPDEQWSVSRIQEKLSILGPLKPLFVLVIDRGSPDALQETLKGLDSQNLAGSRVRILWQGTSDAEKSTFGGLAATWQSFLEEVCVVPNAFVVLIEGGYVPKPNWSILVQLCLNESDLTSLIYWDDEELAKNGRPARPIFKPDWNQLLLTSRNYIGSSFAVSAEKLAELGEFELRSPRIWDLILCLACRLARHEIVHLPLVLGAVSPDFRSDSTLPSQHLISPNFEVKSSDVWKGILKTRFKVKSHPKVSVIIPTRDRWELLQKCVESLLTTTVYPDYEILIVDNDSREAETLRYLKSAVADKRIKVVTVPGPFNYSALNNKAALQAKGSILALLNNDMEIIEPDWMEHLSYHASRPESGAVGCRLLFPDGTIQHAGMAVGYEEDVDVNRFTTHPLKGLSDADPGYESRAICDQWITAVTGACLFVRKDLYCDLGGLDEEHFPVTHNDADFCLRAHFRGFRNVYAGTVSLIHNESATRGLDGAREKRERLNREVELMCQRWGRDYIDGQYNVNMSLSGTGYCLAWPPRFTRLF